MGFRNHPYRPLLSALSGTQHNQLCWYNPVESSCHIVLQYHPCADPTLHCMPYKQFESNYKLMVKFEKCSIMLLSLIFCYIRMRILYLVVSTFSDISPKILLAPACDPSDPQPMSRAGIGYLRRLSTVGFGGRQMVLMLYVNCTGEISKVAMSKYRVPE